MASRCRVRASTRAFPLGPFPCPVLSFRPVASFGQPFPAAGPIIPPPGSPSSVPAVQRSLCRRGPNHALQRTEAGGRLFFRCRALLRQPLSLSLSPLGALPLCSVLRGHVGSRSLRRRVGSRSLCLHVCLSGESLALFSLSGGSAVIPPPVGSRFFRRQTPSSTRLTRRSSERRGWPPRFWLLFLPPSLSLSSLGGYAPSLL